MSYTRTIAHNTIYQITGKAVSTVIGIVVIGMLTRYLGVKGFGQYTTIMAFLQLFGVLVDFGLYIILVKKISEPGADEASLVGNVFTLRLFSAIIFLGLAPLVVLLFPYPAVVKWGVLLTTLSYLAITLNQVMAGVFQKHLRMNRVVMAEVAGRLILIAGTYAVIAIHAGLLWVMATVVASSVGNFLLTFSLSRSLVRFHLQFDWPVWRAVIRESWPIALSIAFNLVYFKADTIILSLFKPEADVGVYGASYKVLEVLTTVPAMFAGLVLPLLAAAWAAQDMERFKRVLQKAFDAMALIAVPLAFGTYFIAQPVMDLIAPEFTNAGRVLQLLIVATATIFIGNLFGNTVVAINKQRTMMWLYLVVAVVSLAGYLALIPRYSYYGAAAMTIASELMVTLSAVYIVIRSSKVGLSLRPFNKAVLASAVMAIAMHFLRGQNLAILLFAGVAVYGVAIVVLRGVTRGVIQEIIRPN